MIRPVALIGAELEENLSLRYLAVALAEDGVASELVPFHDVTQTDDVVARIVRLDPLLVGISVPFQSFARQSLHLADRLRAAGLRAHITAGGHFATFEYANILRDHPAVDSVVRHEGELTLREICRRLRDGQAVVGVPGTLVRGPDGIVDGGLRRLAALDELPFPDRRGEPHTAMGVPASPIVGSRGCYADCAFCCIYAYGHNADGARYRRRSPENIAREMWREYTGRGVRLFVFHDDNFFVPSVRLNLTRYRRLKQLFDGYGMNDIGLVIKCRPNDVDPELFTLLRSMGLIRAYVGIETNSDEGIVSLNRRITPADNRRALEVLQALDVYRSFNVLIFDPEATLQGVARNLDFMEEFSDVPFNFCRAEVYAGTPLKDILERQGRLRGDYLAWGYEMRDPRVEMLFRIAVTAFNARNFKHDGVANLNMGIRFDHEVVHRFYPGCIEPGWLDRVADFSTRVGRDTVAVMRAAHAFAANADVRDSRLVKDFTIELARRIARADLDFVAECRTLRQQLEHNVMTRTGNHIGRARSTGKEPWAGESFRLGSSVGLELSSEALPAPRRITS